MSRRLLLAVPLLVVLALAGVAFAVRGTSRPSFPITPQAAGPAPGPAMVVGQAAPAAPVPPPPMDPPPPPPPPEPPPKPKFTYDAFYVQRRLQELKYYFGAIDGKVGEMTYTAVMAFQKVNGLDVDGDIGPQTVGALSKPVIPSPAATSPATHVEVDLTKQVAYWVEGGVIQRIMPVSSGNGEHYLLLGAPAVALTPVGWYQVQVRMPGLVEGELGGLYDPMYFYSGWALHGSSYVPPWPASHGCVRFPRWDALWLYERAVEGTDVYLYGGTYTFTAGSSAPGTDRPGGDSAEDMRATTSRPAPAPQPPPPAQQAPAPAPAQQPVTTPKPSQTATPSGTTTSSPSATSSPKPTSSPTRH